MEFMYHLHLEAANTLLSVHLFTQLPTEKSVIFRTINKCHHSYVLMSAVLHFTSRMVEVLHTMFGSILAGSFVFDIVKSLLSVLTFRKQKDILKSSGATGAKLAAIL